jgi:hypothetical protein
MVAEKVKLKTGADGEGRQDTFAIITDLKKICNDPKLLYTKYSAEGKFDFGSDFKPKECQPEFSSKMEFVDNLLKQLKIKRERIVIVSNYTEVTFHNKWHMRVLTHIIRHWVCWVICASDVVMVSSSSTVA